ncbi:SRPBCC domain-containing protein [Janibacter cremeus]|uniref:SRPBCC domain-containing protein n=1 Tax=Janibacter cremeus TaxID=1285192 RepID=UPI0023F6C769|nr:SRPBCC domain-containing protein [Janibacter cremeus]WEV76584.1 SRPBCC domain-containing protein [Janibacter cremeus]
MAHHLYTEIEIDAPPARVWGILTDLAGYSEWNPFITSATGTVATGERLVNRLEPPGGKAMTFRPTVTEVDEGRAFEWLGRLGLPGLFDGRHRFVLVPHGDGTRLIQSESFTGILVPLLRKSLDAGTRAGFQAMNVALKARAEAMTPGGAGSTP